MKFKVLRIDYNKYIFIAYKVFQYLILNSNYMPNYYIKK